MTDQPMMTLVIEVPLISAVCDGEKDKFATKFGQIAQGVLFEATAAEFGLGQAEMESLYTTSRGTISTNKKMLRESGAAWAVVAGQKLQDLMGGNHAAEAADTLSDSTMATVESLENPPATAADTGNVVALDPNQAAAAPAVQGLGAPPQEPAVQQQVGGNNVSATDVADFQAADPNQVAQMPAPQAQPAPMAPPAPVGFDVLTVDVNLAQHMQTAPHPTGDAGHGVVAGEVLYWQANPAAPQGGTWLKRVEAYSAFGQLPPEQVQQPAAVAQQPGLGQQPAMPGHPAIGQPVGPQGQAVQRVTPVQ